MVFEDLKMDCYINEEINKCSHPAALKSSHPPSSVDARKALTSPRLLFWGGNDFRRCKYARTQREEGMRA
jgi:hypothetical protein